MAEQRARRDPALQDAAAGRRRDKGATKQALLAAGVQVFARRGYDAATTREVAQAAGVNEQLIQRYFGGKSGLLLAIIERFGAEERQSCAMPPPCPCIESEVQSFLEYHLERACEIADVTRVALHRSLCDPDMAREIGRQFAETRVPLLRQRLEALRERGLIDRAADLDAAATALSSLSFGLAFVDQLVFGADCARLRRVTRHVARMYALGLARRGWSVRGSGRHAPARPSIVQPAQARGTDPACAVLIGRFVHVPSSAAVRSVNGAKSLQRRASANHRGA